MKIIRFELNGNEVEANVEPGEVLLDTLRERFFLTGAKRGCEVGECGACTVLIDDVPITSCLFLSELVDGKKVITIEGLSDGINLHPVQEAFVNEGAIQCGYCTPGMVLSAYALLKKNLNPTREEIKKGLSGNFCRCGAYEHIIVAVQQAAAVMRGEDSK